MLLSHIFKDRVEAGIKLSLQLQEFKNTDAIVLALSRGGVVTGAKVAHLLNLPLDIIVTRKIGAPRNKEYALGAIDLDGNGVWNESEIKNIDKEWLNAEIKKERQEAIRRWSTYRGKRGPLNFNHKTVIIVDDGIATGMTMKAAVQYAKKNGSARIIVATPVAPRSTIVNLEHEAEVRVLETPNLFFTVGQWYKDFPQIKDKEVVGLLSSQSAYKP